MAADSITNAISNIKRNDPIMGQVIDVVGDYRLAVDKSPFRMLIRSIAGQQLSVAAAGTIWYRFLTTNGGRRVSPNSLAKSRASSHVASRKKLDQLFGSTFNPFSGASILLINGFVSR